MASHAMAQSATQPRSAVATTETKPAVDATKTLTAATNAKSASPASTMRMTAAGSVIVLADGMVANATMTQFHTPARGFVYER